MSTCPTCGKAISLETALKLSMERHTEKPEVLHPRCVACLAIGSDTAITAIALLMATEHWKPEQMVIELCPIHRKWFDTARECVRRPDATRL
jgi:hypothetical protein